MTAWRKNPEALRALVLTVLTAVSLSACTTSPRTQLSWNVQDHHTYYGPHAVTLPPVEQRRLPPPSQVYSDQRYASVAPKPKPRTTPGWYTVNTTQPVQPAPQTFNTSPPQQYADSSVRFRWPLNGHILSSYGATDSGERNDGINIAAQQGEPVRASASGTVSYCGNELRGYGNLVLIKHDNGYITAYAHVDSFLVNRAAALAVAGAWSGVVPTIRVVHRRTDACFPEVCYAAVVCA